MNFFNKMEMTANDSFDSWTDLMTPRMLAQVLWARKGIVCLLGWSISCGMAPMWCRNALIGSSVVVGTMWAAATGIGMKYPAEPGMLNPLRIMAVSVMSDTALLLLPATAIWGLFCGGRKLLQKQ